MEKLESYEHYADVLAEFKKGKAKCASNKFLLKDEITALITAGKLYYSETEGVMWFFSNEDYFYTAYFYVPADTPIRMQRQDMDVLVELTGNESRYNQKWEDELIAAGYEKGDKYLEYGCDLEQTIDTARERNTRLHEFCRRYGFTYRKATKADYPEMWKLWEDKLGKYRYTLNSMTEAELDEMERYGRCILICGQDGKILATNMYKKKGENAYPFHTATYCPEFGLGGCVGNEMTIEMYDEGCRKSIAWIREGNREAVKLAKRGKSVVTGKFYFQFICKSEQ